MWLIDWFLFTTDIRQWSTNGWIVKVCTVYTYTILHSTHSINNSRYIKQVYIVLSLKHNCKRKKIKTLRDKHIHIRTRRQTQTHRQTHTYTHTRNGKLEIKILEKKRRKNSLYICCHGNQVYLRYSMKIERDGCEISQSSHRKQRYMCISFIWSLMCTHKSCYLEKLWRLLSFTGLFSLKQTFR